MLESLGRIRLSDLRETKIFRWLYINQDEEALTRKIDSIRICFGIHSLRALQEFRTGFSKGMAGGKRMKPRMGTVEKRQEVYIHI